MAEAHRRPKLDRLAVFVLLASALVLFETLPGQSRDAGAAAVPSSRVMWESPVTTNDLRKQKANNSPALAADPTDARFLVLANRLDAPEFGCALQVSNDGGRLWRRVRAIRQLPRGVEKCYAPEVGFDREGVLHYLFVGLAGRGNSPVGAFLVTSSDQGRSFSAPLKVLGPERYMIRMAIDRSSERSGRIHLVWLQARTDPPLGGLGPPPNPIMHAFSDDGGRRFSKPVVVAGGQEERVVAPALALGPKGEVHVLFYDLEDDVRDYQGLEGPVWEGNWSLRLNSSFDGGRRFRARTIVDDGLIPPERVMLIFTMPPASLVSGPSGELFASWYDARNGDWDVFVRRSTNRGRTWGGAVRLNEDASGNGRHQYLPRLSVSSQGRLDAIFYDRRNDAQNLLNDVYYARSNDGGKSFEPNIRISSESFHSLIGQRYAVPSAANMFDFGSRLALVSNRGSALAAWTDTRNYFARSRAQDVVAGRISLAPR